MTFSHVTCQEELSATTSTYLNWAFLHNSLINDHILFHIIPFVAHGLQFTKFMEPAFWSKKPIYTISSKENLWKRNELNEFQEENPNIKFAYASNCIKMNDDVCALNHHQQSITIYISYVSLLVFIWMWLALN